MSMQGHKFFVLTSDSPFQIQTSNTSSINALTSVLKTCLGPKSFQKLLITKQSTLMMTSDGHSIVRELDLSSPALKLVFEVSRTQDEVVGDGTTSVIILVGEVLKQVCPLVYDYHPSLINSCIQKCYKKIMSSLESNCRVLNDKEAIDLVSFSVSTKLCSVLGVSIDKLAIQACKILSSTKNTNIKNSNIKNKNTESDNNISFSFNDCLGKIDVTNLRIEKVLGPLSDSKIIHGQLINKNIYHSQMRREIKNPRVILIQSGLEYKKGESQTLVEFSNNKIFSEALEQEEKCIKNSVEHILKYKPDIVCCEKGIGDYALSLFQNNNVTALRRFKKSEIDRLEKGTGAKLVNSPEMVDESCVGEKCGIFKYIKISDEYYCLFDECKTSNVCTLLLSGPTRDVTNEIERNFWDAFKVMKCLIEDKRIVPGGGSTEFFLGAELTYKKEKNNKNDTDKNNNIDKFRRKGKIGDLERKVENAISEALKSITTLLCINSGGNPIKELGILEKKYIKHKEEGKGMFSYGIDGKSGKTEDIKEIIMEPFLVKSQAIKSIIDAVCMLLRVDGIIQGSN